MSPRVLAALLALVPGLACVLAGSAGAATLALAIACHLGAALLVARARAGVALEGRGPIDALLWLTGAAALLGVTCLASPFPFGLGTDTRGRHAALVLGALVATACVFLVSAPSSSRRDGSPSA